MVGMNDGGASIRSPQARARDRRLIRELSVVLLKEWDPISVGDAPEASDEYAGYAAPLLGRLLAGASEAEVFSWLGSVARDRMGLDPDSRSDRAAAASVLAWWDGRDR